MRGMACTTVARCGLQTSQQGRVRGGKGGRHACKKPRRRVGIRFLRPPGRGCGRVRCAHPHKRGAEGGIGGGVEVGAAQVVGCQQVQLDPGLPAGGRWGWQGLTPGGVLRL